MKIIVSLFCLLFSAQLFAQLTPQEIKKFKISSISSNQTTSDGGEPAVYLEYFDQDGNDTAYYINEMLVATRKYQYNNQHKIIKRTAFDAPGNETENAIYTYKPDGSFSIANTDTEFKMTDYEWYDKLGRLIKSQSPDGNTTTYTYDAKGRLIKAKSNGYNGGDIHDIRHSYNEKNQRVKTISEGTFRWVKTYSYDAKGIIVKAITVASDEGVTTTTTEVFEYTFRK